MQLQERSGISGGQDGQPSAPDIFASIDADSSGSVTEAEFVSTRPGDMSEDDARALFATIDTDSTGSITEEQLPRGQQPDTTAAAGMAGSNTDISGLLGLLGDTDATETSATTVV